MQPPLRKIRLLHGLSVSKDEAEDVVPKIPYCTGTVRRNHAEMLVGYLPDSPLRCFQNPVQTFREFTRRETIRLGILDSHKISQAARIPSVKGSISYQHGRHRADPMARKFLERLRFHYDIDRFKFNPP